MRAKRFLALVALSVLVLSGCGQKGPRTTQVEGTVTYKGQPVEKAAVMFTPAQPGQGLPAAGQTDASGKFTLWTNNKPGAAPGEYTVTITKTELVPTGKKVPKPEGGMEDEMTTKDLLPVKYKLSSTTPLKVKVETGKVNQFQFDLQD